MSHRSEEPEETGISDEDLPADLVPDQDNPLAEGLPTGDTVEGLLEEGKRADQAPYAPAEGAEGETDEPQGAQDPDQV